MSVTNIITERTVTGINESEDLFLDNSSSTVNNTGTVERDIEGINESEDLFLDNSNSTVTNTGVTIRDVEGINESEALFPDNTSSDVLNIGESILPLLRDLEDRAEYYENEESTIDLLASNGADLLNKASLIMTPTAYSDGELHNVKPSVSDADFDFTRNSSATRINEQGLIEEVGNNIPRIDYLNDSKGALLLEPARTNLNTFSDPTDAQKGSTSYASVTFQDNFNWGLGGVLENAIVFGDNSTTRYAYYSSTVSSGTVYSLSFFIKMDDNSVPIPATDFLLVLAGTSIASGYNVESCGNNVYRVSVSGTASASNTASGILKVASHSTKGFKISAFQLEQGSYATSYIPTSGSAVTRLADVCNGAGNEQVINSTEGVLYAEIAALADDLTFRSISINANDTRDDQVMIRYRTNSNVISFFIRDGGSVTLNKNVIVQDITKYNKVALKYKNGDISAWINGVEYITSTATGMPSGLNKIGFQLEDPNVDPFFGNVKDLRVYNTALSDSELQALTT